MKPGWLLATQPDARFRGGPHALQLAARVIALTRPNAAEVIGTLVTARADVGRFADTPSASPSPGPSWPTPPVNDS